MRNCVVIIAVLLAASLAALAGKEETLEQLKARAESARPEERPGLYTEIARRQVEAADQLYAAGKVDAARAAVGDVAAYSEKARDSSVRTGKRLKQTEIGVRKMAVRLRDIKRTLAFEDQAPVQAAIDHLEQLRTDLLSRMFGKKEEK
jgi:soluble cytochrome b562